MKKWFYIILSTIESLMVVYVSYSLSGLFIKLPKNITQSKLIWSFLHPLNIFSIKSIACVILGIIISICICFLNYNNSKKPKKKRTRTVELSTPRDRRIRSVKALSVITFLPIMYVFYSLSGIFAKKPTFETLESDLIWYFTSPIDIANKKSIYFIIIGLMVWGIFILSQFIKADNTTDHGNEHGDAKWGKITDFNRTFKELDENEEDGLSSLNKVYSENVRFKYNSNTLRNNNMFVVGGSGAGKTSFLLTPNLLSLHDCNVYTDPKGTLVEELGGWLGSQPNTNVYVLDLCDMKKSMKFNPFAFIRSRKDIRKLITNLQQNTENDTTKNAAGQDPFWPKAESMFLQSLFLYVWMETPFNVYDEDENDFKKMKMNMRSVLELLDEAQFKNGQPPKLDKRMEQLPAKHPARICYERYRGGADETVRSVLMTTNARLQVFDDEELLQIFDDNEIPLDEFGVGHHGDKITKSNLFIIIPDDDDTFNFVPGMVYTLFFQELNRSARLFGGRLPMDVGFWLDEFANIKMPNNFDKILSTCRSRGVYCVPILQSLAQIKTLFADGAWEGIVGNCDTFIYLGGNEYSTYEYIEKLLGEWTMDKKSTSESKGSSGSTSESNDVIGRKLMQAYELRLLPNDECIIFVKGELPIRDKKWYPWEHERYKKARKLGAFDSTEQLRIKKDKEENCEFLSDESLEFLKKQAAADGNAQIYKMSALDFMNLDLNEVERTFHAKSSEHKVKLEYIQTFFDNKAKRLQIREQRAYEENFDSMNIIEIFANQNVDTTRKHIMKKMNENNASEQDIKAIIRPELQLDQVHEMYQSWLMLNNLSEDREETSGHDVQK